MTEDTARPHIRILQGDITQLEVDAIVNAANSSLLGGGGVDGAIHKAAGPELLKECVEIGNCITGQAVITKGYKLPAKYVIHTVGPVYQQYHPREAEALLRSCYQSSLDRAVEYGLHSIAFPCISCGVYGYPLEDATRIALQTVCMHALAFMLPLNITFVCFTNVERDVYNKLFNIIKMNRSAYKELWPVLT